MKKEYNELFLQVTLLCTEDVVRTSEQILQPGENELPFVPFSFEE